jgi:SAM-dependent methyltransferase
MLKFVPLEKIQINKPVDRLSYISKLCKDKKVLDIGCYDETAVKLKEKSGYWLHSRIAQKAKKVIGIDSSNLIRSDIKTGRTSKIIKKDLYDLDDSFARDNKIDVIVAGELIEHLPDASKFLRLMKNLYPGKMLVLTTPNATSLTNILLAMFNRESNHKDHTQIYSYKTLYSLCLKNELNKFKIIPYQVRFTEMYLKLSKFKGFFIGIAERFINFLENIFPMFSGGYMITIML